jgi:hypothetical protein
MNSLKQYSEDVYLVIWGVTLLALMFQQDILVVF